MNIYVSLALIGNVPRVHPAQTQNAHKLQRGRSWDARRGLGWGVGRGMLWIASVMGPPAALYQLRVHWGHKVSRRSPPRPATPRSPRVAS